MPPGGVRPEPPGRKTGKQPRPQRTLYGRTRKNPTHQKNSSTSRHHGHGRNQGQNTPVCQLWKLYAETSVELKRKSKLSQEDAVTACKVYRLYISDVLQQVDKVMKLFTMEKELRIIKTEDTSQCQKLPHKVQKIENTKK